MTESQPSKTFRPRRSCLYMPGSNTRAMEKARTIDADVVILDLEDAVLPNAKAAARQAVRCRRGEPCICNQSTPWLGRAHGK